MRATKINEYSKNKKTSKSKNPYKRVISNIRNYGYEYVSNKKQVIEITKLLREDEILIAYETNNSILIKIKKAKSCAHYNEEKVIWVDNVHDIQLLKQIMYRECFPYLVVEIDIKNNPTNELKRFYFINEAIKYIGKKTDRGIFIKRENADRGIFNKRENEYKIVWLPKNRRNKY